MQIYQCLAEMNIKTSFGLCFYSPENAFQINHVIVEFSLYVYIYVILYKLAGRLEAPSLLVLFK